jgi:hypothetical protein
LSATAGGETPLGARSRGIAALFSGVSMRYVVPKVLTRQANRQAVAAVRAKDPISERSACGLVG